MNINKNQMATLNVVKRWTDEDVLKFLVKNNLQEYVPFAKRQLLDGFAFLSLSEGMLAMARPRINSKKLFTIIEDLRQNPQKYVSSGGQPSANQSINTIEEDTTVTLDGNESVNQNGDANLPPRLPRVKPKVPVRKESLKEYSRTKKDAFKSPKLPTHNVEIIVKMISEDRKNSLVDVNVSALSNQIEKLAGGSQNDGLKVAITKCLDCNVVVGKKAEGRIIRDGGQANLKDIFMKGLINNEEVVKNSIQDGVGVVENVDQANFKEAISKTLVANAKVVERNIEENKNVILNANHINLSEIIAPRSFLYDRLINKSKPEREPYMEMSTSDINEDVELRQKDVVRRRRIESRIKSRFEKKKSGNRSSGVEDLSVYDRGYYDMDKTSPKPRRYSEGNVELDENIYEELTFNKELNEQVEDNLTIMRRVEHKRSFKDTKIKHDLVEKKEKSLDKVKVDNTSQKIFNLNKLVSSIASDNYIVRNDGKVDATVKGDSYKKIPESIEPFKDTDDLENKYYQIIVTKHTVESFEGNAGKKEDTNEVLEAPSKIVDEDNKSIKYIDVEEFECHYYEKADLDKDFDNLNICPASKKRTRVTEDSTQNDDVEIFINHIYETADDGRHENDDIIEADIENTSTETSNEESGIITDHLYETADVSEVLQEDAEARVVYYDTLTGAPKRVGFCENYYETADVLKDLSGAPITVEEYLEPRQFFRSIDDDEFNGNSTMDSLTQEMMKLLDVTFGTRSDYEDSKLDSNVDIDPPVSFRDTKETSQPAEVHLSAKKTTAPVIMQPLSKKRDKEKDKKNGAPPSDSERPFETLNRWNEQLRSSARRKKDSSAKNCNVGRPLPVPVENEFYYMDVSRKEAESLLEGHADGTFILRPSSQTSHAYTVTLTYQGRIYNIGCRRRQDNRLALGYSKTNEQSFLTIHELIEHYYKEKIILLVDGEKVGSTVLKKLNA